MGLTICKRIVDHYGGTISCYSAGENKGSTFMFSMKMKQDEVDDSEPWSGAMLIESEHGDSYKNNSLITSNR